MFLHERLHCEGEGGRVEKDLPTARQVGDHPVQHTLEVLGQQLVRLVQNHHPALTHIRHLLLH